ncbi:MAG TPA: hypothetical protein LFV92_00705 [Rickettsia endosymbiont of Ceroptres masudai]|nr:hypothetical protein [Rickettsia endosymbiont of Ceroptres masudai]
MFIYFLCVISCLCHSRKSGNPEKIKPFAFIIFNIILCFLDYGFPLSRE